MKRCAGIIFAIAFLFEAGTSPQGICLGAEAVEVLRYEKEWSKVRIEGVRMPAPVGGEDAGIGVVFEGTNDLHYYARKETAPGGYNLTVEAKSAVLEFGKAVYPTWGSFYDIAQKKNVEVYVGNFTVFIPITAAKEQGQSEVEVKLTGIACTSDICLPPFEKVLRASVDYSKAGQWSPISFERAVEGVKEGTLTGPSYPVWFALGLAFLAGLSLNIMPCVWPVLPLVVMRIVEQAKKQFGKSFAMGLTFCAGILLFFGCLAGANIVLRAVFGTVLQWGDQFRNPWFVAGMAVLLVVLALFMFDVFTITVPSSIASKSGGGKGYWGTVGMGFLAAILSTPCSFATLAAAFAWAQAQPPVLATGAIMVIGVGMATPYVLLTAMPGLLSHTPRPGKWMELFKQGVGFILLAIAAWMITVYPAEGRTGLLYFSVVAGFCVWMWGKWVDYGTKLSRKITVRLIAATLAILAGFYFLSPKIKLIDWQDYDGEIIAKALSQKQPVLIKFTADWCMSCKFVEKAVYSRGDIAKLIKDKKVVAVKADTTVKDYPATLALKDVYKEPGVPVSILLTPGKEEVEKRWRGKAFGDELKEELEKLP